MKASLRSIAIIPLLSLSLAGSAQCPSIVDITSVQTDKVEVWIRPQSYFGGYFAAMSFTIRWFESDGADLGSVEMQVPYFGLAPSGPPVVDGSYKYQRYAGFATTLDTLGSASLNAAWQPEEEILLARIAIIGMSSFEIIEDAWTNQIENNANYYISLNGNDCQGEIYSISTYVPRPASSPGISISPNPTTGNSTIELELPQRTDLQFELIDPAGRSVWQTTRTDRAGRHTERLDMNGLASGVYMLHLRIGEQKSSHRIVLTNGDH